MSTEEHEATETQEPTEEALPGEMPGEADTADETAIHDEAASMDPQELLRKKHDSIKADLFKAREARRNAQAETATIREELVVRDTRIQELETEVLELRTEALFSRKQIPPAEQQLIKTTFHTLEDRELWANKLHELRAQLPKMGAGLQGVPASPQPEPRRITAPMAGDDVPVSPGRSAKFWKR